MPIVSSTLARLRGTSAMRWCAGFFMGTVCSSFRGPAHPIYQVEGEILAKLIIPASQIERADFFYVQDVKDALANGQLPSPDSSLSLSNNLYFPPSRYSNVRDVLS
jgi:hypothetical protein